MMVVGYQMSSARPFSTCNKRGARFARGDILLLNLALSPFRRRSQAVGGAARQLSPNLYESDDAAAAPAAEADEPLNP